VRGAVGPCTRACESPGTNGLILVVEGLLSDFLQKNQRVNLHEKEGGKENMRGIEGSFF